MRTFNEIIRINASCPAVKYVLSWWNPTDSQWEREKHFLINLSGLSF